MTDGVEPAIDEGQRGAVRYREVTRTRVALVGGPSSSDAQSFQGNICQRRVATGYLGEVQCRPSGSGTYFQEPGSGTELQQPGHLLGFFTSRPARPAVVAAAKAALQLEHDRSLKDVILLGEALCLFLLFGGEWHRSSEREGVSRRATFAAGER